MVKFFCFISISFFILLVSCNQPVQKNSVTQNPEQKIDSVFQKREVTDSTKNNLFIYYIGRDSLTNPIFDTIFRYYPVAEINDSLAILEGSRTLTFMAFKSLKERNVYLYVNDSASFSFDNILDQIITNKDESFFRKSKNYEEIIIRPKYRKNGFITSFSNENEMASYGLISKNDTIGLDEEGCNEGFGAIMRDNFIKFSDKFYTGINSDKFFENWGLKPLTHGNFTVFLRTMRQYWFDDISKIVNGKSHVYLHCDKLSPKYRKLVNCNKTIDCSYIDKYQLSFRNDTLRIIYANMYQNRE